MCDLFKERNKEISKNYHEGHLSFNMLLKFLLSVLSSQRIGLQSMLGVYIVLSVGLVLSFLILAVENFWYRCGRDRVTNFLQNRRITR